MNKLLLTIVLSMLVVSTTVAEVFYSKMLENKAIMGDGESMYQLSLCYYNGWGIGIDFEKSNYWIEQAAKAGQQNAVTLLRVLEGNTGLSDTKRRELDAKTMRERERIINDTTIDYNNYNDVLLKRAQNGEANAQFSIGHCYYVGNGVQT